jgi:hypothetical protein
MCAVTTRNKILFCSRVSWHYCQITSEYPHPEIFLEKYAHKELNVATDTMESCPWYSGLHEY